MLTGFHGLHVIMELSLYSTICTIDKDHFRPEVTLVSRPGLVLALCRCSLVALVRNVYVYGSYTGIDVDGVASVSRVISSEDMEFILTLQKA